MVKGQCFCGAVSFEIEGPLSAPSLCHCGQCRRLHGAPGAYTSAPVSAYRIRGEENLNWYSTSHAAEQSFCRVCGSKLFWREVGGKDLDATMGSLDAPTGLTLARQKSQFELTLAAENLAVSAGKLPAPEGESDQARREERVTNLRHLIETLDLLYDAFAQVRFADEWSKELAKMQKWLRPGER